MRILFSGETVREDTCNRWMAVAEVTGDAEKIIEQIMIERLLDAVCSELRAWLKEQKPKSAEELGNLANLHVQSRKGLFVRASMYQSAGSLGKRKNQTVTLNIFN